MRVNIAVWWGREKCPKEKYVQHQSWTVVVGINKLQNLKYSNNWHGGSASNYGYGSIPQSSQIYSPLMPQNWHVKPMGVGNHEVMCRWRQLTLAGERNWGCANGGAGVSWQTVRHRWWFFATACVEIFWRWVHWQRGVRCVGSQGREAPWEQNRLPPLVNITQITHS